MTGFKTAAVWEFSSLRLAIGQSRRVQYLHSRVCYRLVADFELAWANAYSRPYAAAQRRLK